MWILYLFIGVMVVVVVVLMWIDLWKISIEGRK
jgi:hypothetical protein